MDKAYKEFFKAAKQAKQPEARKKSTPSVKKKKSSPRRSRKEKFPLGALIFAVSGLCVTLFGFLNIEKMEELINNIEVSAFGSVVAAEKKEAKTSSSEVREKAKTAGKEDSKKSENEGDSKNWTEKDLSHFSKLNDRKKELDMREAELNELEKELHKQKSEVESRIKKLEELRMQIAQALKERVEIDEDRVKKLVDFYSNMKPQQAAKIISTLNEDLAVEVLGRMKKKNAADIMNLLEPNKAQVLSEKFAGYKR